MNCHRNYGLAGGILPDKSGFLVGQQEAAIRRIDEQIKALLVDDPAMYYDGDFSALLDRRNEIARQMEP